MNRKLLAMALIALVSPVLLNSVKAATVIDKSNVTIERNSLPNNNAVTVPTVTAEQVGEVSWQANVAVTKAEQPALVENEKDLALVPGGLKFQDCGMRLQIDRKQSRLTGGEKKTRPIP